MRAWTHLIAAAAMLSLAGVAAADGEGDLRGIWKPQRYVASLRTTEGKPPPLLPGAAAVYRSRLEARRTGSQTQDPLDMCQPAGTPRSMFQMRPFMLVQTPRKVTLVHEFQHLVRHVPLDEALSFDEPTWQGTSVGHWDHGALVIETAGFNGKTWLDEAGLPHSEQLKVTERLTRSGRSMTDEITLEDPVNYSAPWKTRVTFEQVNGGDLAWHVCTEKLFPMPPDARPGPPGAAN
jgi:hypothetical protein